MNEEEKQQVSVEEVTKPPIDEADTSDVKEEATEGSARSSADKTNNRSRFIERMKGIKPDVDFEDEEQRYGAYDEAFNDINSKYDKLKASDEKLKELFGKDPRFASLMVDMAGGEYAPVAFARHFGDLMEEDMKDPEVAARVAEENQNRIAQLAKEEDEKKKRDEEREANLQRSGEVISQFAKEKGLSDEEAKDVVDLIVKISDEGITGNITHQTLELLLRGNRYDAAVEEAATKGVIDGRNERIRLEKNRRTGDGIPHLSTGTVPVINEEKKPLVRRPDMYKQK